MSDEHDEPIFYVSDDGRVLVARDFRRIRNRDERVRGLVRSLFDDARARNR